MFELQDASYRTVAFGTREQVNQAIKDRVADGRYRIIGPDLQVYCIRIEGVVYPDPETVPIERPHAARTSTRQYQA